jgi:hypothetical protein
MDFSRIRAAPGCKLGGRGQKGGCVTLGQVGELDYIAVGWGVKDELGPTLALPR